VIGAVVAEAAGSKPKIFRNASNFSSKDMAILRVDYAVNVQ
jgi:hypothetical protein